MATTETSIEMPDVHTVEDLITLGENITPSQYFDNLKNLKVEMKSETLQQIAENVMTLMKKSLITGQKKLATQLIKQLNLINNELKAVEAGFNVYVLRVDIELYIQKVEGRTVKIIELENYERDIPDDVVPMIEKATPYFDKLYVLFTDYANTEGKKVEKTRRDKDPILFGAFAKDSGAPEPRLYFIADWVDEKCDLTLEELCLSFESMTGAGILRKTDYSTDIDTFRKQLAAMSAKSDDDAIKYEDASDHSLNIPESRKTLKDKVGDAVKKATRRRGRPKKTQETDESEDVKPKVRRTRKKKTESSEEA